jgi:hypothetical protein
MSANVEFNVTAFDDASSVFTDVSDSATQCFTTVTTGASEASDAVQTSGGQMQGAMQIGSQGSLQAASSMSAAASSAAMLAMSAYSLESAETSLDKAHVTVERDTNSVATAQLAYNEAVAEYGAKSEQAQLAYAKLTTAQDALQVAQQRVGEAQNNVNETMIMAGLSVIPTVLTSINAINNVMKAYPDIATAVSGATEGISDAMDFLAANPIVLVIVGIAALAIGLYEAYEHCAPFRDAINEIGTVLGGAIKAAFTAVSDAANFLWNDVLKPFGDFLGAVFFNLYLKPFEAAWDAISSALNYLWNNVLVPVGSFLQGAFSDAINFVMGIIKPFEDAINAVSKALSPITNGIGDLTNALKNMCFAHAAPAAEEFNKQLTAGIELSNQMTQKLDPLKQGLLGVAGSSGSGSSGASNVSQQQTQVQQDLLSETKNLTNVMNKLTYIVGRGGSADQSIALALQRRM